MAQRDNRHTEMGTWNAPPRRRRYGPLSGAAKYPRAGDAAHSSAVLQKYEVIL
jgi:hypothetical protein